MGLTPSAILFLILATACGLASCYLTFREIEEVNRKLPEQEQIEYALMHSGKMKKIKLAYKRFYPQGGTDRWCLMFQAAGFLFLGLTALQAGFLR
jgi:hypothetical protein